VDLIALRRKENTNFLMQIQPEWLKVDLEKLFLSKFHFVEFSVLLLRSRLRWDLLRKRWTVERRNEVE